MGKWREVKTTYGMRERWVPEFYADWPSQENEPALSCLPQRCPRCGGTLTRWVHKMPSDEQAHARHERLMLQWRNLGAHGPEPEPELQMTICTYDLNHGPACGTEVRQETVTLTRPERV